MDKSVKRMYRIKEQLPGIYGISSSAVMCWLAIGQTGAMLVDTAYGFADLSEAVREITELPLTVVNSHGHIDHTGGNFFFDTPVYLHEADRELYRLHNRPETHRGMEKSLKIIQNFVFWRMILPKHPEKHDAERESFDRFLSIKEGDSFDLGGLTAQIIEIPGHTAGSIAVFFPEKKLLITSDGANPGTYLFLPESKALSVYLSSLRKLEKLDFQYILTGHSKKRFTRDDLKAWIEVAEKPGLSHAKEGKPNYFASGITPLTVWAESDIKHKGPTIVIDPNKID